MDNQQPNKSNSQPNNDAEIKPTDVTCIKCGYNLTGVAIGSTCPECGSAINPSIQARQGQSSGYAVAALVLGIFSIVGGVLGFFCGPFAIYYAAKAKKQIIQGHSAPSSMGMAIAGKVCGIIGVSLATLALLVVLLIVIAEVLN